ncbi:hypothetical protein PGT21_037156 [Puccinia graminis f. sp. tritici]|uniref:Uncharacterized protein n=1 Tax=Puccinia graminis f. sp. tritici TaxID=56615 RepID=A0A5B0R356_PUCGR|nr:hypothetical protein PGT21_037156 [Puccinia graminis f. sp. tritici]
MVRHLNAERSNACQYKHSLLKTGYYAIAQNPTGTRERVHDLMKSDPNWILAKFRSSPAKNIGGTMNYEKLKIIGGALEVSLSFGERPFGRGVPSGPSDREAYVKLGDLHPSTSLALLPSAPVEHPPQQSHHLPLTDQTAMATLLSTHNGLAIDDKLGHAVSSTDLAQHHQRKHPKTPKCLRPGYPGYSKACHEFIVYYFPVLRLSHS